LVLSVALHRAVGIAHVPLGSLQVIGPRRLLRLITNGDRSVLGPAALRTPPAVRNAVLDPPVQSGSVGAGLASRHDPADQPVHLRARGGLSGRATAPAIAGGNVPASCKEALVKIYSWKIPPAIAGGNVPASRAGYPRLAGGSLRGQWRWLKQALTGQSRVIPRPGQKLAFAVQEPYIAAMSGAAGAHNG